MTHNPKAPQILKSRFCRNTTSLYRRRTLGRAGGRGSDVADVSGAESGEPREVIARSRETQKNKITLTNPQPRAASFQLAPATLGERVVERFPLRLELDRAHESCVRSVITAAGHQTTATCGVPLPRLLFLRRRSQRQGLHWNVSDGPRRGHARAGSRSLSETASSHPSRWQSPVDPVHRLPARVHPAQRLVQGGW